MKYKHTVFALTLLAALTLSACGGAAAGAASANSGAASSSSLPSSSEVAALVQGEYHQLTAEQAKARLDSGDPVILVDVRTEAEYNEKHIPDAVLIPNETIGTEPVEALPELDAEILLYCRSGNRSRQAAEKLAAIGYTNVYDFGGINDWPYDTVS